MMADTDARARLHYLVEMSCARQYPVVFLTFDENGQPLSLQIDADEPSLRTFTKFLIRQLAELNEHSVKRESQDLVAEMRKEDRLHKKSRPD